MLDCNRGCSLRRLSLIDALFMVREPGLQGASQAAPAAKPGRARIRIADHLTVDQLAMLIHDKTHHYAHIAAISKVVFGRWL